MYHSRSYSLESDTSSSYFQLDHSPGPSRKPTEDAPHLHLDPFFTHLTAAKSTSPSPRSPDAAISPLDDRIAPNGVHAGHGRVPSHVHMNGNGSTKVPIKNLPPTKKSMPDLRPARLHLPNGSQRSATHATDHFPRFVIQLHECARLLTYSPSFPHLHHNSITDEPVSASPISIDRPIPSMDTERNSYFRRLSTLSAATISKAIPESLLAVVDAVRGILFALSQIYQTLQHYTVYAIDERLSAVLQKVLGPASTYMSQLIHALDRFDTVSRKALPSPSICRSVVETCRDNVTVFGKAVGMLSLQLKVLAKHDDVRYTRQMLLVLYGAMSEISAAWQSMALHIDSVKPYLWETRQLPASKPYGSKTPTMRSTGVATDKPRTPASAPPVTSSPFLPAQQPETPQRSHLRTNTAQRSLDLGKSHISRRHAGSFSSKDVEIGKMLPSYVDPPPSLPSTLNLNGLNLNGWAHSTPTPAMRTMRRLVLPLGQQSHDSSNGSHSRQHSRQGSQSSLFTASNSSPSLGAASLSVSGTSTLVDKEVIGAMKAAVEAAPEIWELMDEMLDAEGADAKDDFREMLGRAKDVTERLRGSIAAVQEGAHSQAVDGKALHDDAHLFVKVSLSVRISTTSCLSNRAALGPSVHREDALAGVYHFAHVHAALVLLLKPNVNPFRHPPDCHSAVERAQDTRDNYRRIYRGWPEQRQRQPCGPGAPAIVNSPDEDGEADERDTRICHAPARLLVLARADARLALVLTHGRPRGAGIAASYTPPHPWAGGWAASVESLSKSQRHAVRWLQVVVIMRCDPCRLRYSSLNRSGRHCGGPSHRGRHASIPAIATIYMHRRFAG